MNTATVRAHVLSNAVESLSALNGVEAIYLSGSLAEGSEDEHSDIDLRIVVSDEHFETVRAARAKYPTTWGPFLFHQTVADTLTVSYYESLTKADVFYFQWSGVPASPWFNLGTRILLDRTGRLSSMVRDSKSQLFTAAPGEIESHLKSAIAGLIEAAKRVHRGQPIYASRLCTEALHHLFVADDLLCGRAPLGSSKRERISGDLTDIGSIRVPSIANAGAYFHRVLLPLRDMISTAEMHGHVATATAAHLSVALDQLVALIETYRGTI